jgi:hypothetical protein
MVINLGFDICFNPADQFDLAQVWSVKLCQACLCETPGVWKDVGERAIEERKCDCGFLSVEGGHLRTCENVDGESQGRIVKGAGALDHRVAQFHYGGHETGGALELEGHGFNSGSMGCEHFEHLGIAEDTTPSAVKKDFFELVGDVVLEGLGEGQGIPFDTELVEAVDDTGGFGIDLLADA